MLPVLILLGVFAMGFCLGYAVRGRRSRKRRSQYLMYSPYFDRASRETSGRAKPDPSAEPFDGATA